jgi:hypothetical protein
MVASGLAKTRGLSVIEISKYLIDKPGVVGNYTVSQLVGIIAIIL